VFSDTTLTYQGVTVSFLSIANVYKAALDDVEKGIASLGVSLSLPEGFASNLRDRGDSNALGYSISSVAKPIVAAALARAYADKSLFPDQADGPPSRYHGTKYLQKAHQISEAFQVCFFLGGGMPPRGSELVEIYHTSGSLLERNLFLEQCADGFRIRWVNDYDKVRRYHSEVDLSPNFFLKTMHAQHRQRRVIRFLHHHLSRLYMIYYLSVSL
jgi:hypothetical protein